MMRNKRVVMLAIVIVGVVIVAAALLMVGPGLMNAMITMHGGQ
jgi:hypothetical protein